MLMKSLYGGQYIPACHAIKLIAVKVLRLGVGFLPRGERGSVWPHLLAAAVLYCSTYTQDS